MATMRVVQVSAPGGAFVGAAPTMKVSPLLLLGGRRAIGH